MYNSNEGSPGAAMSRHAPGYCEGLRNHVVLIGPRGPRRGVLPMFPSTFPAMEPFLLDFLSDAPVLVEEFYKLLKQAIQSHCARKASDLPIDIRDEVLQETLTLLCSPGLVGYDASRGSAESVFCISPSGVRVRNIRAAYGIRTESAEDELPEPIQDSEGDFEVADPGHPEHRILLMVLTNEILDRAGQPMAGVLSRIYLQGEDQEAVLEQAGLDRFSFRRRCLKIGREVAALRKCA